MLASSLYFGFLRSTKPEELSSKHHHRNPLMVLTLLHGIALFGQPIYEDDHFRYQWDGYQTISRGSPFGVAPESYFDNTAVPVAMQQVLSGINHPELPTIYGPVPQIVFAFSYLLHKNTQHAFPALTQDKWMRLLFALLHLTGLFVLLKKAHSIDRNSSPPGAVHTPFLWLYVLNPLVFKEVALTGHFDFLIAFALMYALLLPPRKTAQPTNKQCAMVAGVCLALACASKWVALIAAPVLLFRFGWLIMPSFLLAIGTLYAPFYATEILRALGEDAGRVASLHFEQAGLVAFAQGFEFNAGVFAGLQAMLGRSGALIVLGVLGASFALDLLVRAKRDPNQRWQITALLFAALILLSPTINPWYWLWVLPFGVFFNQTSKPLMAWVSLVSFLLLLSYGHGLILDGQLPWLGEPADIPYALPWHLQFIEHGLIACAAFAALAATKMKRNRADKICHNST
jgi:alpha-1,6-mannosyltransferase